ncbi:aspartic proteinase CDR1-like [Tripterygium wilfordii]|uniref:aspartic proteinase CDR1-like n=1 Tax=Tripterygium wilfordii TaxID=458696 RepID=UPI0018F80A16|nr:aspartic proteinase CDR1-like [Tripterygium wilfordii]
MGSEFRICFLVNLVKAEEFSFDPPVQDHLSVKEVGSKQNEGKKINFSIDLFHRDSPPSPLYNSSLTPYELMRKAVLRSYSRVNFLRTSMHIDDKQYVSSLTEYQGQYFIEVYIGSPPVAFHLIADTGSSLIWVKYSQDYKPHHFYPPSSSTYQKVSYNSEFCKALGKRNAGDSESCEYDRSYPDGSYTSGILGKETFHLNLTTHGSHPFDGIVFGCSKEHYLYGGNSKFQGIVGLGAGVLSLVSQLKSKIESKFSYCLVPITSKKTNKLRFGAGEMISGVEVVSTPIVLKHPPNHYYVSLEGISIGGNKAITGHRRGKYIMIDSGTFLTMLHSSLYNNFEPIVKNAIDGTPIENPPENFKLCYETKSIRLNDLPKMVFHFEDADIHLLPVHTFMQCPGDVVCMTIVPNDNLSILGSMAQVNFLVEFDLQNKKVSFARVNCAAM